MSETGGIRSALPWMLLLSAIILCGLCAICGIAGAVLFLLSRPEMPSPAPQITATPTISFTPTVELGSEPGGVSMTPTDTIPASSPSPASPPDPNSWRTMGDPDAPVLVEEFGDFQCPYCGLFYSTTEQRLREEYISQGKVRFIFRNFIVVDSFVEDGNESRNAALGALCAGEQGKFWEYHDTLFENQSGENEGAFSPSRLRYFAVQLELDGAAFAQCLDEERYAEILDADERAARRLDLPGVPSILINGEVLDDPEEDTIILKIEEALQNG